MRPQSTIHIVIELQRVRSRVSAPKVYNGARSNAAATTARRTRHDSRGSAGRSCARGSCPHLIDIAPSGIAHLISIRSTTVVRATIVVPAFKRIVWIIKKVDCLQHGR